MPLTEMVSNVEAEDLREEDAIALERGLASGSQQADEHMDKNERMR